MRDFCQEIRIEKVQDMDFDSAEEQIFEWVKAGVVSLPQFRELDKANREAL